MANYVIANGVRMWYADRGTGDPGVLLHGGLTDSRDFAGNLDALADTFRLLLPDRRGHGHTPDVAGPITIELTARDTAAFVDKVVGGRVRLVGYSAGAIVALWVAVRRPDLVERLVLISGAFDPAGVILRPMPMARRRRHWWRRTPRCRRTVRTTSWSASTRSCATCRGRSVCFLAESIA
jgi:pimeloyl-ACP methyl ester carboxylesterase